MTSEQAAQAGMAVPLAAVNVIQDYTNGKTQNKMLDNVAKR